MPPKNSKFAEKTPPSLAHIPTRSRSEQGSSESQASSTTRRRRQARASSHQNTSKQQLDALTTSIQELTLLVRQQQLQITALSSARNTPIQTLNSGELALPTIEAERASSFSTPIPHRTPTEDPPSLEHPPTKPYTKLTERIEPLNDSKNPSIRQWKISIRDRLRVNSDHYTSEVTRKALVWATTTGLARNYLEPRYQSDSDDFRSADEMIALLDSYFTTGFEAEDAQQQFFDMRMGDQGYESFAAFKARFLDKAINGHVPESEWFQYMWNKITLRLQDNTLSVKNTWNRSFDAMVTTLISIDTEHIRAYNRRRRQQQAFEPGSGAIPKSNRPTKLAEIDIDSEETRK
jgi:hypothetical protein